MNKNIIIAILIVIIIAIGAAFVVGQFNGKTDTQINIINNETFQPGEHVDIELKDAQGKALSGKNIEINFNNQKYSVTTDQYGKCYLTINGMDSGQYNLEVKFDGDDTYNGCDAKASITIESDSTADNIAEPTTASATTYSTDSSDDNSSDDGGSDKHPGYTYIAQYGAWVDENGIVRSYNDGVGEQIGVGYPLEQAKKWWDGEEIPDDLK